MYETNVNPAAVLSSGLLLPSGNARHYYVRTIADALIGVTGTLWKEVTGSSPTPAFLQPYASTITGTAGTTTGATVHCTLYYTADPRLASNKAVLLRLWSGPWGVMAGCIDTAGGDPDVFQQWFRFQWTTESTFPTTSTNPERRGILINRSTSTVATVATTYSLGDWRFLYWMWDDMLFFGCINTPSGSTQMIAAIICPNDDGFVAAADAATNCIAMIPVGYDGAYAGGANNITSILPVGYPQISLSTPTAALHLNSAYRGTIAFNTLGDGKQIIDPAVLTLVNAGNVYSPPRLLRLSAGFRNTYDVITIGSDDWMCFGLGGTYPLLAKLAA